MITTPDANDAITPCPPFSPVGPVPSGFFADCNPATNFAGTRPIAEYFNELILNLRALLMQATIASVKGDPTMLWRAVLALPIISTPVILKVATGGVAHPVDPRGGDPFDSLASAFIYLGSYRIAPTGSVEIQLAGQTFVMDPLTIDHPDGRRIHVRGAGPTLTTLRFPVGQKGIYISSGLGSLQDLTMEGQSTALDPAPWATAGLLVSDGVTLGNLTITGFAGYGIVQGSGLAGVMDNVTLTLQNNRAEGIIILGGTFSGNRAKIIASNNGSVNVVVNGELKADEIQTTGGARGLGVYGPGTQVIVRKLGCDVATNPDAVFVATGAVLIPQSNAVVGDWWTWNTAGNQPQYFHAIDYGFINSIVTAGSTLAANNRTNTSPALNTVGNVQAYIKG